MSESGKELRIKTTKEQKEITMRYYVLYTTVSAQEDLRDLIERRLPEGRGEAFIPRMEVYRRGKDEPEPKEMFPGYVFVHTSLTAKEMHLLIRENRRELLSILRELSFKARLEASRPDGENWEEGKLYDLLDLSPDETAFLDLLREGNGLLAMSRGYEENKKFHVVEGPLKAYEDRIVDVDKHNRKAFLSIVINGHGTRAGFECKPKSYWEEKNDMSE